MALILKILMVLLGLSSAATAYSSSTKTGADGETTTDWSSFLGTFSSELSDGITENGTSLVKFWNGLSTTEKASTLTLLGITEGVIDGDGVIDATTSVFDDILDWISDNALMLILMLAVFWFFFIRDPQTQESY